MTKTVYLFYSITGEYSGTYQAHANPLEAGKYIEPTYSTTSAPPVIGANQVAIFSGGAWATIPDFRGQTVYDKTTGAASVVSVHGTLPANVSLTIPATIQFAANVAKKNSDINSWRQSANSTSFTWQTKQIACDPLSRSDIDAIANYIGLNNALPASFPKAWKAIDNTLIPIPDVATFKSFYQAMVDAGAANFAHSQALKTALTNAKTQADLDLIIW